MVWTWKSEGFYWVFNYYADAYKNIEEYNPDRKCKVVIIFDMNANTISNKNLNQIVTELFIRRRKLNISTVFITQFYFTVPKDLRLNCTDVFIMKVPNKLKLQ